MTLIKTCEVCSCTYSTPYTWATMCKECFIQSKKDEHESLTEEVSYWRSRAQKAEDALQESSQIEPSMLKLLIQICHPDKHGNSESSVKATKFLLSMRK